MKTITLYRPVGPLEYDLIRDSGFKEFPPRLPEQPIFYPVMNEEYANQISELWNVPAYGIGYVTMFKVKNDYIKRYEVQNVGGEIHNELWIPAGELRTFNKNIVGNIKIIKIFKKDSEI